MAVTTKTYELFEQWKAKRWELDWYATLSSEEMEIVDSWELVYEYGYNAGCQGDKAAAEPPQESQADSPAPEEKTRKEWQVELPGGKCLWLRSNDPDCDLARLGYTAYGLTEKCVIPKRKLPRKIKWIEGGV